MLKKYIDKYNNSSDVFKASIWFTICGFMQRGISIITTPIFTRILTSDQYGLFNVYNSWLELISVFVTLRLYEGIYMKGLITYDDDRDIFTSSLLGLSTLLIAGWFGVYLLLHNFWNSLRQHRTVAKMR